VSACLTNPRVQEILTSLTHAIRLITLMQAHRTWWTHATNSAARATFEALAKEEYVVARRFLLRREQFQKDALIRWKPGDVAPPFGPVAYALRKRNKEPVIPTTAYVATRKTAKLFGGFSGGSKHDGLLRHPLQASHDANVSALYFRLLKSDPDTAKRWVPEERLELQNRGGKLFDAVIVNDAGKPERVFEIGGAYGVRRLLTIHNECVGKTLPYELW